MKKTILFGAAFLLVLTLLNVVNADNYCFWTMHNGEKTSDDYYTCRHTSCQVCANAATKAYASWNKCGKQCDFSSDSEPNLILNVNWPFADNGVYTKSTFFLDITTSKIASISLTDNLEGTQRSLCPNCREYKRSYTFKQGFNDLTIKAVKGLEFQEQRISFFIDNRIPRISKTLPVSNEFISSEFTVYYDEDNVEEITLNYGVIGNYKSAKLSNCPSGLRQECSVNAGLEEFDGQRIEYWFTIEDIAGNVIDSKHVFVRVDESPPVINSLEKQINGRYVNFRIDMTEANLYKAEYMETSNSRPRWIALCSSLKNGICEKKVSFSEGEHDISIQITDKAGHAVSQSVSFFTDSKNPKITKTLPVRNKYADGVFMIEFIEENPASLALNYGDESKPVILAGCEQDRTKTACFVDADLSRYNGQEISYWFNLTDKTGASAASKELDIKVDTAQPKISSFSHAIEKRYLIFNMAIDEENFFKVEYMDNSEPRARWKTICSSLKNGNCFKKIYFRAGEHDLDIRVSDRAGNYALKNINFNI